MSQTANQIPVFKLYEESQEWTTVDLLHWEPLADRCQLHLFNIRPHRHNDLVQIFYLKEGEMHTHLDSKRHHLKAPCLLVVAAMCVHDFHVTSNINGHVLSLTTPLLQKLIADLDFSNPLLKNTTIYPLSENHHRIDMLFKAISEEYQTLQIGREQSLESLLKTLVILIGRMGAKWAKLNNHLDRGSQHLIAFTKLVETHYKTHQPIGFYAQALNITAKHLNAICQKLTKKTALNIIHQRLLLEAKRNLIYTSMTISEISYDLRFTEPAYFTRFFKRSALIPPKEFRLKQKKEGRQ